MAQTGDEPEPREVKLFGASVTGARGAPGEVIEARERLIVACGAGSVAIEEVQPAGRSRMPVFDWVRGRGVQPGRRFA
jgi:methionyl-tRNA formyltransferase